MDKTAFEKELRELLNRLFALSVTKRISVKEIPVASVCDEAAIRRGVDACWHDSYSDADLHVWMEEAGNAYRGSAYRTYLPRIFEKEQILGASLAGRDAAPHEIRETLRVCLKDGFRADLIIHIRTENPALPGETVYLTPEEERFEAADRFWFCAVQALGKLMRGDYLIADHLSHALIMEGLVLQMQERDREHNTSFHRYGYREPLVYREGQGIGQQLCHADETFCHIADNLYRAVVSYERLMKDMCPQYEERSRFFFSVWETYLKRDA